MQLRTPFPGAHLLCLLLALAPSLFAADKKKSAPPPPPVRATLQPVASIPVAPLGFAPPGELYMGYRIVQASLDFLDEDHLLFTFRVAALMHRDARAASQDDPSAERQIHAVVLHLPDGTIEAEDTWTLHDRSRYLYMLDHGQFFVRDGDTILQGDASLKLKPFLHFPGSVLWVELDPTRQYLVTGSTESSNTPPKPGDVPSPETAKVTARVNGQTPPGPVVPSQSTNSQPTGDASAAPPAPSHTPDIVLRILFRSTGAVMLVAHVGNLVHVPLIPTGYLESIRGRGARWEINFNPFTGPSARIAPVQSYCSPLVDFLSETVFLVTGCDSAGEPRLTALSTAGRRLWQAPPLGPSVWPVLVYSQDGARFARETLMATHEVNARQPLDAQDIRGQDVQIINSANGKVVLRAAASPVLDAGGNVAIAPSNRRAVILMDGALRLFQLPPPPTLPTASAP